MIKLKEISKSEFDKLENAQKLIWEDNPVFLHYAMLTGGSIKYGMAWHHAIEDYHFLIESDKYDLCIVATWDKVFGLSISKGNVVLLERLVFTLVDVVCVELGFLIITEVYVAFVSGDELIVHTGISPTDGGVIVDFELLSDNRIKVKCDNDKVQIIKYLS